MIRPYYNLVLKNKDTFNQSTSNWNLEIGLDKLLIINEKIIFF